MNIVINSVNKNPKKFYLSIAALVFGLIGLILYLATGVIAGYTEEYSIGLIVIALIGIIANAIFSVKRMDTVETIPFIAYIIYIFLFLSVNANYIMAVVRAIDINSFSVSFVATILLFLVAAIIYAVGLAFKAVDN